VADAAVASLYCARPAICSLPSTYISKNCELLVFGDFAVELNQSAICSSMAHDVFISHAHKDKRIADAICERLESVQVRCWIAERDIASGEDWTEATRNAIGSSRVMVLVLSENANAAPHIEREIAHAFYTRRNILPVRLTKTLPRRDFLFYIGNVPWFDAFSPPTEQHLEALTESINGIVRGSSVTRDAMPPHRAIKTRTPLDFSDSWIGALRASHYRTLEILKRLAIAAAIFAVMWLSWFVHSQTKQGVSLTEDNLHVMSSALGASPGSSPQATADATVSKPAYAYTRFGLWAAPNIAPTPSAQEGPQDARSTTPVKQPASETPSPRPDVDQNSAGERERSAARDNASVKSVQEDAPGIINRTAPIAVASPPQKKEPLTGDPEPAKLARINQSQVGIPLPTPSVTSSAESTPLEARSGRSLKDSPEEQSLKELVLEYLRTVASNDGSTQERFFAGRVNFYGKGVLSFPEIAASMERYRREWPIRKWEPKGEPEFPNTLHSSNPDMYEVLQPFDWTVANGSRYKQGSATLYVRIRKAENGAYHIFHLEQRDL